MQMGRTLRRMGAVVEVSTFKQCLSACVLVLAGGASRIASGSQQVGNHVWGVGVHSFYRSVGSVSEADALSAYTDTYNSVKQYLEEMRIPQALLDLSYSVRPWDMRMLTEKELSDTHLNTDDPVYRDYFLSKEAAARGIPILTLYERLAKAEAVCKIPQLPTNAPPTPAQMEAHNKAITDTSTCIEQVKSGQR
jgi:hypothetical protein